MFIKNQETDSFCLARFIAAVAVMAMFVPALYLLSAGCGSTTDIVVISDQPEDQGGAGATGGGADPADQPAAGEEPVIHDPLDGISLVGVNSIDFELVEDGISIAALDTTADVVPVGGFNGAGTGNKAFVGLKNYGGVAVSDMESLAVSAALDSGVSFFYLNLQVDCDGDGLWNPANDGIVVVDSDALPAFVLPASGDLVTIALGPDDAIFKMVGGPKVACGNLPSHLSHGIERPLTDLPLSALFFNGQTRDNGMPAAIDMSAILFVMGDSTSRVARAMTIESITFNSDEYILH